MTREVTAVDVGDHFGRRKRYLLRIVDSPTEPGSNEMRDRMLPFVQEVVDNPRLLECGTAFPDHFVVSHDGTAWTLSAEAESGVA